MNNDLIQVLQIAAKNRFRCFVEQFWNQVIPSPFVGGYFVDCLCEHLQAVKDGQIKRLMIAAPPRHGKSLLTQVFFPAWAWLHDPTLRILSAACGEDLAGRDSLRTRQLITSQLYQRCYGDLFKFVDEQNAKLNYTNNKGGSRKAVGAATQVSGWDADYLLIDDLIDLKRAKSDAERKTILEVFATVLSKRLVLGTGKDRIVCASHRVHQDDLFNHVWNIWGNDGTWTYLVLPAEAKPQVTNSYHNAIGWKDSRQEGEPLSPERFGTKELEKEKKALRHDYNLIFNQDDKPRKGERFNADWFRYWHEEEEADFQDGKPTTRELYSLNGKKLAKDLSWRVAVCDTAISQSKDADYTVVQVWDIIGNHLILVDQLRKRLNGSTIVPAITAFVEMHAPQFLSVESAFIGKFVIDQLRQANVTVREFDAKGNGTKEGRAVAAEIRLEAGQVWFPANRGWVADLEGELLAFPNGSHDDQTDCLSMICIIAERYKSKLPDEPATPEEQEQERVRQAKERFNAIMNDCPKPARNFARFNRRGTR